MSAGAQDECFTSDWMKKVNVTYLMQNQLLCCNEMKTALSGEIHQR